MTTVEEEHAQVALVALAGNASITHVFDGAIPNPTPEPPYVLVYTRVAWPRDGLGTALNGQQVTVTTTYTCHCVALTPATARAVQAQVRSTLLNLRPVIVGRSCSPIKQDEPQDPVRDESTGRLVVDAVAVYNFTSTG